MTGEEQAKRRGQGGATTDARASDADMPCDTGAGQDAQPASPDVADFAALSASLDPGQSDPAGLAEAESEPSPAPPTAPAARALRRARRHRTGLGFRLFLLLAAFLLAFAAFGLSGKPIHLPVFLVAEIEARMNKALAKSLPDEAVAIGGVELQVDADWVPRLRLDDLRLLKTGGGALITLPDVRVTFDPRSLLRGEFRPRTLRISGAQLRAVRNADGQFDLSFGNGEFASQITSFAQLFQVADSVFASPVAASLTSIEAEGLTFALTDQRVGRTWQMGDGRLALENRSDALALEVSMSLLGGGAAPAHADVQLVSDKGKAQARVFATISNVAAQDLALQSPPLAWLGVVEAPISGQLSSTIDARGIVATEARLDIGAGALKPSANARPVRFDHAAIALTFDPAEGRIAMTDMSVQSPSMSLTATGQSFLLDKSGATMTGAFGGQVPEAFLAQIHISQAMFDPQDMFEEPLRFSDGALDLRLRLDPFTVDVGQLALTEGSRRLHAKGKVSADAAGWTAAVDMGLNEITHDRLMALWPTALLPGTRDWIARNVLQGALQDVKAALRITPGQEPRLNLGYTFSRADVRFLPTLPPIKNSNGYAVLDGSSYLMSVSSGTVTPPQGGQIDVAGSVFEVPEVTAKPAQARITLQTRSSLTASLSLLDQPPFHFMSKADKAVTLGQGEAVITTHLTLPLQKRVALSDVSYDVTGRISGFQSDTLVPNRVIKADELTVQADKSGLSISGEGRLGGVPFNATYRQNFAPQDKGKSSVTGTITLSQATTEEFGLGLPSGMVSGEGRGSVDIRLTKGAPGELKLTSDLAGIGLSIPEIGYSKPAAAKGKLAASVTLGAVPKVNSLDLSAAGLVAQGSVSMRQGGGLDVARFDKVTLGDWLNASVEFTGRGKGRDVALGVTGGRVDLRRMPDARARRSQGRAGVPISLVLNELRVSSGIALTDFRGNFSQTGGMSGDFTSGINGKGAVRGTVVPSANGLAVRLQSQDAGTVLAAAGLFSSARGGSLDLTLTPRAESGTYDGRARVGNVRVRNASVLTELLNAVSVVGILDQLNGDGIVFNEAEADFLLTPQAIQITKGSAIGASLGVSMAGIYQTVDDRLTMQGVVSPVYLLNGIGSMLTRRGEGLFGFTYSLRGPAGDPQVSVNPLSILTPGMFREIFRAPVPVLREKGATN